MLNNTQIQRLIGKIFRFEQIIENKIFDRVEELSVLSYDTKEQLYTIPQDSTMKPIKSGDTWGGPEYTYGWFKTSFTVPAELDGKTLFVAPKLGGLDALLWVDGKPFGTFATKIVVTGHGNHYCDMCVKSAKAGQVIDIAIESYGGHNVMGTQPFETDTRTVFNHTFEEISICTKNELVADFYFDLRTIIELYSVLDDADYRKADLVNTMLELHEILYYSPENIDSETFEQALIEGRKVLAKALAKTNGSSAPYAGVIGHSHMDTAWLWHVDETIKKCARTFSNQINLMEQYPEYTFVQSSSYHSDMIKTHYPQLFEDIKEKVAEGRYEPNGGVWVECDCNITSGESMIRQFLWGQRFTRENFGYTSDSFWLPDTFGYSASIPQIMKGCGYDYFLTTKMAWNDTNLFPYDTFNWKGIDGTSVFTHLNKTHVWPSPKDMYPIIHDSKNNDGVKQKHVANRKLISYGFGDGGGGPQFEMVEMARRVKDLEGCPKTEHTTVTKFMKELEATAVSPATFNGELYLELHRGTLTNQHTIKRNNRLAEINLHNLEYLTVQNAVSGGVMASDDKYRDFQNTVLINQFHDILPGTCIPRAHDEAIEQVGNVIKQTEKQIANQVAINVVNDKITVVNPTSFTRNDVIYIDYVDGLMVAGGYKQQIITKLCGAKKLAVAGVVIEPYASVVLTLEEGEVSNICAFEYSGGTLRTPFAVVKFNKNGYMDSFIDTRINRELRGEGFAFNTFLVGEDVPTAWDNWDVDADLELKMKDTANLLSSEVISCGEVEVRIRNKYQITKKSTIEQDMIFYADSPMVKFETVMDWNDNHRFLKTAFDTTMFNDFVRQEVQFGYIKRPTTRNTSMEQAKFEVLNHKYTDLSEQNFGVAILNDCKYAISANEGQLRLSLHKGGCRPDPRGDMGKHYCEYAFLPHNEGFNTDCVIKPAYEFNYKTIATNADNKMNSFIKTNSSNIIIETIKACEDSQNAYIVRMYDAVGAYTNATVEFGTNVKSAEVTNMLEETLEQVCVDNGAINLTFRPFEIKTIKVYY